MLVGSCYRCARPVMLQRFLRLAQKVYPSSSYETIGPLFHPSCRLCLAFCEAVLIFAETTREIPWAHLSIFMLHSQKATMERWALVCEYWVVRLPYLFIYPSSYTCSCLINNGHSYDTTLEKHHGSISPHRQPLVLKQLHNQSPISMVQASSLEEDPRSVQSQHMPWPDHPLRVFHLEEFACSH